jgi:hypothetical protein
MFEVIAGILPGNVSSVKRKEGESSKYKKE